MGMIAILFLLVGALPVALIIWLLVYLMRKNEWGQEKVGQNDKFDKGIKLIYMYMVTLVMLFACIGFAISAINSFGYVFFPETGEAYQSYKKLVPALVGVGATLPTFLYHFKQTRPKERDEK